MDLFHRPWMVLWAGGAAAFAGALNAWASSRRRRLLAVYGRPETLSRLSPAEAPARRAAKAWLQAAALGLLLLALAGPQWGVELVVSESIGTLVVVAVDTSLSMLAEDLKPNRFENARNEMTQLLEGLRGQRAGVVAFAGEAQVLCPLTTDIDAAKSLLSTLNVGTIAQPGTAIGRAIETASRMLSKYPGHKAIVLLSDGEDRRGDPIGAARAAAEMGIHLFVIGVGSTQGDPIPVKDPDGKTTGYKKDKAGATVITQLAESSLVRLAAASNGAYYRATPQQNEASSVLRHIQELERSRIRSGSKSRFKDRYRIPLALALLALLAEMLICERRAERREPGLAWPALRERRVAPLAILAALVLSGCGQGGSALDLWRGNRAYGSGDYEKALDRYEKTARRDPRDPKPAFNAGDAQYKLGRLDDAQEAFSKIAPPAPAPAPRAASPSRVEPKAYFNLGDTLYRKERYPEAAEAFRRCLLLDPSDEDCRFNLAKALRAMKNPPPKDKPKPDKDKDKGGQDQKKPPQPPPRPQPQLSQEDAERILQAIQEKEKSVQKRPVEKKGAKPPPEEIDW